MARSFYQLPLFEAFDYFEPSDVPDDNLDDRAECVSTRFRRNVGQSAREYVSGLDLSIYSGTTYASLHYPKRDYVRKHPVLSNPAPNPRPYYATRQKELPAPRRGDTSCNLPDSQEAISLEVEYGIPQDDWQSGVEERGRQNSPHNKRHGVASECLGEESRRGVSIQQQTEQHRRASQANSRGNRSRSFEQPGIAEPQDNPEANGVSWDESSGLDNIELAWQGNYKPAIREDDGHTYYITTTNDQDLTRSQSKPAHYSHHNTDRDLKFRIQRPNAVDHHDRAGLEKQPGKSTSDQWRASNETVSTQVQNQDRREPVHGGPPANTVQATDHRIAGSLSKTVGVTAKSSRVEIVEQSQQCETSPTAAVDIERGPQTVPRKRRARRRRSSSAGALSGQEVSDMSRAKGKSSRAARHQRFDPARILQHVQLAVPDPPEEHGKTLFTCLECQRRDCKRLVKSHHGPKTICDKCAYQSRQKKQVDELVNARMQTAAPPAAGASKPRTPRRSGRVAGSSQNSCPTPRSRTKAEREAQIRAALQAHHPTPGVSVMQEMFGGTPLDMMHRREVQLIDLLQDDAPQRLDEILRLRTKTRAQSPELRGTSTLRTKHQRGAGSESQRDSQGSCRPPADKKKRHMTFDTPILGQASKRPRLTPDGDDGGRAKRTQLETRGSDALEIEPHRPVPGRGEDQTSATNTDADPTSITKTHPSNTISNSQKLSHHKATPGSQVVSVLVPKSSHPISQSHTIISPRQALVEQSTNRVSSPMSSSAKRPKVARKSNVHWAGSPPPAALDGADTEDEDDAIGIVEIHGPSQYPSTQTMLNAAYEDFEGALDSPDKPSPQKRSKNQRSQGKGTPYRAPFRMPDESPDTPDTSVDETPNNAAPINTQALFDAYSFTPTSNASPTTNFSPLKPVKNTKSSNKPRARPSWLKDNNNNLNFGTSPLAQTPTGSTASTRTSKGLLKSVLKRKANKRSTPSTSSKEYMTRDSTGSYVSEHTTPATQTKSSRTSLSSVTNAHLDEISPTKSSISGWLSPGDVAGGGDGGMDLDSFLDQTSGMLGSWDVSQEAQRL